MARRLRQVAAGFPHHVVVRGNNRRRLFSYPRDYERFLREVAFALDLTGCRLHAAALMANHVHLVVTPPIADALPRFAQRACQRYAQYRNRRRDASGKLFEQRYWSDPLLDGLRVAAATLYVDLNPLRARLVSDPVDYRWSTFPLHAGHASHCTLLPDIWTPSAWYESLGEEPAARARRYVEWADAYRTRDPGAAQVPDEIVGLDEAWGAPYELRLRRPDGTRASELRPAYGSVAIYSQDRSRFAGLRALE